ncbi:MAG: hypothetical protein E7256_15495 [Lachnospiraceae bacterium]|nr:hypothetical protein [Lachnospiraceae bacterium]
MGLFDRFKKGKKTEGHKEAVNVTELKRENADQSSAADTSAMEREAQERRRAETEENRKEISKEDSREVEKEVEKEEEKEEVGAEQIDQAEEEKNAEGANEEKSNEEEHRHAGEQEISVTAEALHKKVNQDASSGQNTESWEPRKTEPQKEPSIPITLERKNEIGPIIFEKEIKKEKLEDLNIQEVIFLIISLRHFREKFPQADFEQNEKVLYDNLIEKVKNAETLYMTFDKATHFPFINMGYVDLYSKKEYAEEAAEYYEKKNYRPLEVKEVKKDTSNQPQGMPIFGWLYYLGMEKLLLDNGKYKMEIKREEILPPPDYSHLPKISVPVTNPPLRYAIINFFEEMKWRVNYPQRKEQVQQKENKMIEEICKAKYLIPMKQEGKAEKIAENKVVMKERGTILFAKLVNTEQASFVPLFTDWTEFQKAYDKKEWNGMIVSIMDAITLAKKDGVVINPLGENLILNQNSMEEIKKQFQTQVK